MFSCDLCEKLFSAKSSLINHMQSQHMEVKFNCSKCSRDFRSHYNLMFHVRYEHNKKFMCNKCDASFHVQSYLNKHVQVQHEGKRYHCSFKACSSKFTFKTSAKYHLKKLHTLNGNNLNKYYKKVLMK